MGKNGQRGLTSTDGAAVKKTADNGGQFKKGEPPPANAGRKKGSLNKTTLEGRELARQLVEDPDYRAGLRVRLLSGEMHPAIESMLWHYAYGKPKENADVNLRVSLADLALAAHEGAGA